MNRRGSWGQAAHRWRVNLAYRLTPLVFEVGDPVELIRDARYRGRLDARHLPCVPAGTHGVITAIGPMPGYGAGCLIEITDASGQLSGYWTGAPTADFRRIPRTWTARPARSTEKVVGPAPR